MNRDAKRIGARGLRPQIDIVKGYIRQAKTMFDGDGYVFTTAIQELRKEGWRITYHRRAAVYTNDGWRPREPQQPDLFEGL